MMLLADVSLKSLGLPSIGNEREGAALEVQDRVVLLEKRKARVVFALREMLLTSANSKCFAPQSTTGERRCDALTLQDHVVLKDEGCREHDVFALGRQVVEGGLGSIELLHLAQVCVERAVWMKRGVDEHGPDLAGRKQDVS